MATLSALIVLVTLTAATVQARTGPGSIEPTVRDNRVGLKVERSLTNRALERRCREGRYWPAVRSVWAIPRRHVEAVLQRELRRQRYARRSASRCGNPVAVIRFVFPDSTEDEAISVSSCETVGFTDFHNPSGASGLFQLMPFHWRGKFDPFNHLANARYANRISSGGRYWGPWLASNECHGLL